MIHINLKPIKGQLIIPDEFGLFTFMTYQEKLKDPRWQKKRLEILQRDNFRCVVCGDDKTTLHVHHKNYQYNKNPWNYKSNNFMTLCESCHSDEESCKLMFNDYIHDLLLQGKTYKVLYDELKNLYEDFIPQLYIDFIECMKNDLNHG